MNDQNEVFKPSTPIPSTYKATRRTKKIAVVGAGWFGAHAAIELSKAGYLVTIYEKNRSIFGETSGTFGVRIHAGPHYPRSFHTRKTCHSGLHEMQNTYPEVCNEHLHAVYAHGKVDADGNSSKVKEDHFGDVCKEFQYKGEFNLEDSPFNPAELLSAYDLKEPSAMLGERLRQFFEDKLNAAGVRIRCGFFINRVNKQGLSVLIGNEDEVDEFDAIVDATGFQQNFLPLKKPLPFKMNVFYQPCLALVYSDRFPGEKPISFIVMDGWFPCLMPYDDRPTTQEPIKKYIMTHGKWTILASYETPQRAHQAFSAVDDQFVQENIKLPCEKEMQRFWPTFLDRFEYVGWKGSVLAKIKTEKEFRGSVVFQEPTIGMISIFPGKITNIFDAAREVRALVSEQFLVLSDKQNIEETEAGYQYIKDGVLDIAQKEIKAPIVMDDRNTCSLNTFEGSLESLQKNKLLEDKREEPNPNSREDDSLENLQRDTLEVRKEKLIQNSTAANTLFLGKNVYLIIALGIVCVGLKKIYDKSNSVRLLQTVPAPIAMGSVLAKPTAVGVTSIGFFNPVSKFQEVQRNKYFLSPPNKLYSLPPPRCDF